MKKELLAAAHETIKDLYKAGVVDKITMHHFDSLCFPPIKKFSAKDIQMLRTREHISQPILARILNVSPSTVKHWEIGDKHPNGAALKLLNLVATKGLTTVLY